MKRYGTCIGDEIRALLTGGRNFVDREIMPVRMELDESRETCEKVMARLVAMGMQRQGHRSNWNATLQIASSGSPVAAPPVS